MPAYFEEGFSVRKPMWHGLGKVLDEYPGREEAQRLAGHDFLVVERDIGLITPAEGPVVGDLGFLHTPEPTTEKIGGWKALVKELPQELRHEDPSHGSILHVAKDSYGVVQNETGWDLVDALVGEGAKYETGITLKGGATCSVLAWLPEPVKVPGDDSNILPFLNVSWTHDGSGALTGRSTSVRTVCWNTQSASEAQGKRLGTDFTFKHTKHVAERIAEVKVALQGVRDSHEVYMDLARDLAKIKITPEQREVFVTEFIPSPEAALTSDRVKQNIEDARQGVRNLFDSPSIPDEHQFTAYGLHLAGGEFLDHVRPARNPETKYGRSLLRNEPAKSKLTKLIREVAVA